MVKKTVKRDYASGGSLQFTNLPTSLTHCTDDNQNQFDPLSFPTTSASYSSFSNRLRSQSIPPENREENTSETPSVLKIAELTGGSELAKNLVGNSQVPAAEMEVL